MIVAPLRKKGERVSFAAKQLRLHRALETWPSRERVRGVGQEREEGEPAGKVACEERLLVRCTGQV